MDVIVDHERSCKSGIVECQYQLCMKKMRLEILDSHMEKCSYRPIMCRHCQHFIQPSEWITAHLDCFSDNIVRISINEDTINSNQRFDYVLLGNDDGDQAFAVITTSFWAMYVEVNVYGLENLEIDQFRAEIMIKGNDGHTVVTRPLLSWENFLTLGRRLSNDEYGYDIQAFFPDNHGDLEIKIALNQINS